MSAISTITGECLFKFWSKTSNLDGLIFLAALSSVILIPTIFLNFIIASSIIFDGRNRKSRHLLLSICLSNLVICGYLPILMHMIGQSNFHESLCSYSRALAGITIFHVSKSITDNVFISIHTLRCSFVKKLNLVHKLLVFLSSWGLSIGITCIFLYLPLDLFWVLLVILYCISFIASFTSLAVRRSRCKQTMDAIIDETQEEYHNAYIKLGKITRKIVMVIICHIITGQFVVCYAVWARSQTHLQEYYVISLIVLSGNSLMVPLYVLYEHKLVQKFYYKNCLSHTAVHPIVTANT